MKVLGAVYLVLGMWLLVTSVAKVEVARPWWALGALWGGVIARVGLAYLRRRSTGGGAT